MTDDQWSSLSDQAMTAAGLLYFVTLLVVLAGWAMLRQVSTEGSPETPTTGTTAMLQRLGLLLTIICAVVHFVGLVGRGMAADPNRVPWGNMYEFTITASWVVVVGWLLFYRRYSLGWMAPLILGFTVPVLMVAMLWLHQPVAPLPDALESYWLVIHVFSAILATGTFTLGGLISILYLVKERAERRRLAAGEDAPSTGYLARVPEPRVLDRVAYRFHAYSFPLWTFGTLIAGPIWAREAWSTYWNWDPKEVWAFITWVVYACYLHARATAGWKGRRAAYVALVGLATLWFNFIGVNYFSSTSQHSYAGISRPVQVAPAEGAAAGSVESGSSVGSVGSVAESRLER